MNKHEFEVVQDINGNTNYEELDIISKRKIWASKISGSQMKEILHSPITSLITKWGILNKIDPGKSPTNFGNSPCNTIEKLAIWGTTTTNERIVKKLAWGNYLEDAIFKGALKEYNAEKGTNYNPTIEKRTFVSKFNDKFTANIDGLVGTFDKPEILFEIKNVNADMKSNTWSVLEKRYYWQVLYYMWFFNVPKAVLFMLNDGCQLKYFEYDAKEENLQKDMKYMIDSCLKWLTALETGKLKEINETHSFVKEIDASPDENNSSAKKNAYNPLIAWFTALNESIGRMDTPTTKNTTKRDVIGGATEEEYQLYLTRFDSIMSFYKAWDVEVLGVHPKKTFKQIWEQSK